jgi:hypothetical protein
MAETYDPAKEQIGDNPKHKQFMAWGISHNGQKYVVQYHHGSMGFGNSAHNYGMWEANDKFEPGAHVGSMSLDHEGALSSIEVHPDRRRQGLATKLYEFGTHINSEISSIPAPKHSEARTESGDAWARSVGGDLPHSEFRVEDHNFRANRWGSLRDASIPALKSHLTEFHAKMIENGMDDKGVADSKYHVDSAQEYLTRAHEMGKDHRNYFDTMSKVHEHIDELGDIHSEWYGNMDDHERLQDHIGRLY